MVFESILYLSILVIGAKIAGELFHRINQPTIIGNVLAGVILGPALFSIVQPLDEIELFVSIGVFFLFFLIGLEEIDLPGLFNVLRKRIFLASAVGFLVPFSIASVFSLAIDASIVQSLALASVIGASSLGVTAKVLTDLGKLRSTVGLEIFTITAIIEFIAIVITSVIIQVEDTQSFLITDFAWLFGKMIIFFAVAGLVSVFVLPHFFRLIKNHLHAEQIYFGIVIGMILLVAYFAEISGIHGAIGALLLGIAISRMTRNEYLEISKNVKAVGYGIFIPIFFAGIGLHFSPNFIELPLEIIIGFLVIIVGGKFFGSYLAVRIAKMRPLTTVAYGVMSKGAVDLALMLALLETGLLENKLFSLLVFGTLITMTVSSVELQRKLKKLIQVKIGSSELGFLPVYFKRAVSDHTAISVTEQKFQKTISSMIVSTALKEFDLGGNKIILVFDDSAQHLVGLVSKNEVKKLSKESQKLLTMGDICFRKFHFVFPDEYLHTVIQKMNSHPFDSIPVISRTVDQEVIGVVTSEKILSILSLQEKKKT